MITKDEFHARLGLHYINFFLIRRVQTSSDNKEKNEKSTWIIREQKDDKDNVFSRPRIYVKSNGCFDVCGLSLNLF